MTNYFTYIFNLMTSMLYTEYTYKFILPVIVCCLGFKILYSIIGKWKKD